MDWNRIRFGAGYEGYPGYTSCYNVTFYCGIKDCMFLLHNKPAKIIKIRTDKMPTSDLLNPKNSLVAFLFFKFINLSY